jgi:hypothetical protein
MIEPMSTRRAGLLVLACGVACGSTSRGPAALPPLRADVRNVPYRLPATLYVFPIEASGPATAAIADPVSVALREAAARDFAASPPPSVRLPGALAALGCARASACVEQLAASRGHDFIVWGEVESPVLIRLHLASKQGELSEAWLTEDPQRTWSALGAIGYDALIANGKLDGGPLEIEGLRDGSVEIDGTRYPAGSTPFSRHAPGHHDIVILPAGRPAIRVTVKVEFAMRTVISLHP